MQIACLKSITYFIHPAFKKLKFAYNSRNVKVKNIHCYKTNGLRYGRRESELQKLC
jgi:hypothetical protein